MGEQTGARTARDERRHGVPILPGERRPDRKRRQALTPWDIGYPVIVEATAGGGDAHAGRPRGLEARQSSAAVTTAQRERRAAFWRRRRPGDRELMPESPRRDVESQRSGW